MMNKEQMQAHWDGHAVGLKLGSEWGWQAGFDAAVQVVSRLYPEINKEAILSFKSILDKNVQKAKDEWNPEKHEWDPNVRNDEVV